jgi:hypothetical protein
MPWPDEFACRRVKAADRLADKVGMAVKVASLLAGILCMYFGYKLLMRGIFPDSSDKPVWDDGALLFKRGLPGTVFALFGAGLIVVTLVRSGELRLREAPAQVQQTQTQPAQSSDRTAPPGQGRRSESRKPATTRHERASPPEESNQSSPATTTTRDRGMIAKPGRA